MRRTGSWSAPVDPGLQPERTSLAWTRTLLTCVAVAMAQAKVLAPSAGVAALSLPLAGAVAAFAWHGRRRQRCLAFATHITDPTRPVPGAVPLGGLVTAATLPALLTVALLLGASST